VNSATVLTTLFTVITSSGFIALVATIVKAVRARRGGVRALEREAIADLGDDRRVARADARFFARIAGGYARQLRAMGIEPDPPNPVPPSERNGDRYPDQSAGGEGTPAHER
jgi:hypothetical protein